VSDKINMTELLKERYSGPQAYLLTSLLGLVSVPSLPNVLTEKNADGEIIWDVKLTISGIDVSFTELLSRWDEGMEHEIEERVAEAIPNSAKAAIERLRDQMDKMEDKLEDWADAVVENEKKAEVDE
jgi:hypothetical protein